MAYVAQKAVWQELPEYISVLDTITGKTTIYLPESAVQGFGEGGSSPPCPGAGTESDRRV